MSEQLSRPKWSDSEALRDRIEEHSIYYWYPGVHDSREIYNVWTEPPADVHSGGNREEHDSGGGIITVSDWGLYRNCNINLLNDDVDPDQATDRPRKDSYVGEQLKTFINRSEASIGQNVGVIRRFLVDFAVGTPLFIPYEGSYNRVVPGVVTSEPYFDATGPIAEMGYDENHVYYRRVDWLTDNDGNVVTIPMQALPEPYHGAPSSTGGQCAGDLDDRLLLADALAAGQHLAGVSK